MATSQYFNNYKAANEQNLVDQLTIEAIQIKGMDVKYMPRDLPAYDSLFGEDPTSAFTTCVPIEMYLETVDGFGGDGDLFSKFGYIMKKTAVFVVSKTRFKAEFPSLPRPREGDLIFMPITNAVLEIKYVELEDPFFQNGAQYVYKLKCELFEFSRETFDIADTEVNGIVDSVLGTYDPSQVTPEDSDNDKLQEAADSFVQFDPENLFGGR